MKNIVKKQQMRIHRHKRWLYENLIIETIVLIIFFPFLVFAFYDAADFMSLLIFSLLFFMLAVIFFLHLFWLFRACRLEKCLNSIDGLHFNKIKIECKKVRFIVEEGKFEVLIVGVIFIDVSQKKYYYIYPNSKYDNRRFPYPVKRNVRKNIKKSLVDHSIELDCLKNTNLVKSFEVKTAIR